VYYFLNDNFSPLNAQQSPKQKSPWFCNGFSSLVLIFFSDLASFSVALYTIYLSISRQ